VLKVYAAYKAAVEFKGAPTVVLAKTIKGYGLGEVAEGRNTAHQKKQLEEKSLLHVRDHFELPISDEDAKAAKLFKPADDSPEMKYLREHREKLGGFVPSRVPTDIRWKIPALTDFLDALRKLIGGNTSTTVMLGELIKFAMKDKTFGKNVVTIIPDEAQTFGLQTLFSTFGIYSSKG